MIKINYALFALRVRGQGHVAHWKVKDQGQGRENAEVVTPPHMIPPTSSTDGDVLIPGALCACCAWHCSFDYLLLVLLGLSNYWAEHDENFTGFTFLERAFMAGYGS